MIRHRLSHQSPYTAEQICELVADIDAYPRFIPWIKSLNAKERTVDGAVARCVAEVVAGYKLIRERFSTAVVVDRANHRVTADLVKGPFRHLSAVWQITSQPSGCSIDFLIELDIKIPFLKNLLEQKLEMASERLMACFEAEASVCYGSCAKA